MEMIGSCWRAKGWVREDAAMSGDVVTLQAGNWTARWVPSVGMVGVSLFGAGRELLGQMGGLDAYASRGSTFGLPLLHPWANRLAAFSYAVGGQEVALGAETPGLHTEEHGLPIHGLLAGRRGWEVVDVSGTSLRSRFSFDTPELLAAFPFPHDLEIAAVLSAGALTISTTLIPTSDQAVPVAFGWHPYFTLPGIDRDHLILRTPSMSRLILDDHMIPTGETEPFGPRHAPIADTDWDDAFTNLGADPHFTLAGGGHELTVRFLEGYTHLQLFTPPGRAVVAIEPMTAPTNALRSHDHLRLTTEPFTATFSIDLSEAA
jgi:aldose 1-epimerase